MITQFKIFENNSEPENGDYVLLNMKPNIAFGEGDTNYLNNNVGRIVDIYDNSVELQYQVEYDDWDGGEVWTYIGEIYWFGKTKLDKEIIDQIGKYNL